MSILVTGGTGLVGSYILHLLIEKGEKVNALHRSGTDFSLVKDIYDKIKSKLNQPKERQSYIKIN